MEQQYLRKLYPCNKKAGRTVARTIQGIKITNKILLLFMGYLLINYILLLSGGFAMIMDLVFNAAVGYWLLKDALGRHRILEGTIKMSRGDLEYKINTAELKNDNLDLAIAVNHIGDGLQQAIDKSMKDERMKTELITNVSHDIKTPLTSIINYVDLIKRENIEDPKIKSYIEILDMKSQRLKNLTEDLVEASKVSSGNIELEFIKINFNELIMQTNGEFSEKFAQRRLELITNIPEEPAVIYADGRRIWRIIENLYNNVAKYAMEGTRVYVDVRIAQGNMYFSVKNISEQPLNINASELTERFIRGDVSRSTEGSGLGLSIAKNLTTLQNGKFDIYLDGDLFKVVIVFPLFRGERLSPDKQAESGNNQDKVPETENAAEDKLPDGSKRIHLKKKFKRKKNSVRQIPVETIDFSADSKPAEPEVSLELPKLEEINEQIDKLTLDNEKEK